MRYIFLTTCFTFLPVMSAHLFSEDTMSSTNVRDNLSNDEMYWQRYLMESEVLAKEFRSISESLVLSDIKADWNEDYYAPLFEKSKNATLRITQKEDLRSAFESLVLHGSYPLYKQGQRLYSEERV